MTYCDILRGYTENERIIERHLNRRVINLCWGRLARLKVTLYPVDLIEMGLAALCGFSLSVRPSVCLSHL